MTIMHQTPGDLAPYALSAEDVTTQLGVDPDRGLTVAEVDQRLAQYGPNELPKRQRPGGYVEPELPMRHIPTPF